MQIIKDCNTHTAGGNFNPNRKNKLLHSYTKDSIKSLSSPESKTLEPLIEELGSGYIVTALGINIFDKLPSDRFSVSAEVGRVFERQP